MHVRSGYSRALVFAPALASVLALCVVSPRLPAQIRTPRTDMPLAAPTVGPAPYNAKATATSPTSVTVSWDAMAGIRGVQVSRSRVDNPACCNAQSPLLTTAGWSDAGLEGGVQYLYTLNAFYADGRTGTTTVIALTPMPKLPVVRTPRAATMAASEGVLRLTPCGMRSGTAPAPTGLGVTMGSPAGGRVSWTVASGYNYVLERTPQGSESWTLVGSTCGGPSPLRKDPKMPNMTTWDMAGGVRGPVIYRVTAIGSAGETGWNTFHWSPPCQGTLSVTPVVTGSTVRLNWTYQPGCASSTGAGASVPETIRVTSSFGFAADKPGMPTGTVQVDGVPRGTHTFTFTLQWSPDVSATTTVTATVSL